MPSSVGPVGTSAVKPCQTGLVTSTIPTELKSLMKGQGIWVISEGGGHFTCWEVQV